MYKMSFKRVGDDHSALRLQKKQRVAELFAEDIPADEVSQTRSGRYVCLVCPHNPVLDTMPMLSIHRQGKKHLANMSIKIEKQHNLNELLQKRKQELSIKVAATSDKPLNIERNSFPPNNAMSETTPLLMKTRLLTEQVTKLKDSNMREVQPQDRTSEKIKRIKKNKPFFQSRVELKLTKDDFGKCLEKSQRFCSSTKVNGKESSQTCGSNLSNQSKHLPLSAGVKSNLNKKTWAQPKQIVDNSYCLGLSNACHVNSCTTEACNSGATHRELVKDCVPHSREITGLKVTNIDGCSDEKMNKEQQKRYLELKMSGWLLDLNGKWIKDENVEFDSDDDEPTVSK